MKSLLIGLLALGSISAFSCDELNIDKRAHTTTWLSLYQLNQLNTIFKDSGRISVNSLRTLRISDSEGKLMLADQIHQLFTRGRGAKAMSAQNPAFMAIEESSLNDETVCDLANRLDQGYQFHGE